MKTTSKLMAGILSLIIICVSVIGPVYIAEKLKDIEVSQDDLVPSSSIESTMITRPFWEFNQSTGLKNYQWEYGYMWNTSSPGTKHEYGDQVLWNYDGTAELLIDTMTVTPNYAYSVVFYMHMDPETLLTNGVYQFHLMFNTTDSCRIATLRWIGTNGADQTQWADMMSIPASLSSLGSGLREDVITFSETDLNNAVTSLSPYPSSNRGIYMTVEFDDGYLSGGSILTNFFMGPEYYYTIYENTTITTYEPFLQTITPYAVHKVSFGIGAALILFLGWVASPWGERFDSLLPINNFSVFNRKRTRRRK